MDSESDFFRREALEGEGAPTSSASSDLAPGVRVAERYELVRKIGHGSMGEVWAARHVSLGEEVAIKLVRRETTNGDGSSTESRFLLEARLAAQLSRKTRHVVSVTDHGVFGPWAYLVMELLEGESLEGRLARTGPMGLEKVVPIVRQVARALTVAHGDGVVHRDLKPSNVFVTVDEQDKALVKILDFGIAKLRGLAARRAAEGKAPFHATKHRTMRGFVLGTPAYMSPEQARGAAVDHRADVWALAVIAYHMLTLELPFDGDTPEELFDRLARVDPIPIAFRRPDLPLALSDFFTRAFSARIDQRFQSASALAAALEQVATRQRYGAVELPPALDAISVPPPARPARDASSAPAEERPHRSPKPGTESSIVAAGVPRERGLWPRVVTGAAVVAVLLVTASLVSIHFEREPVQRFDTAAGVTSDFAGAVRAVSARDEVPPPPEPEPAPLVHARDLPTARAAPSATTEPRVTPGALTTTASLPPRRLQAAPPAPEEAPSSSKKKIDPSEVF